MRSGRSCTVMESGNGPDRKAVRTASTFCAFVVTTVTRPLSPQCARPPARPWSENGRRAGTRASNQGVGHHAPVDRVAGGQEACEMALEGEVEVGRRDICDGLRKRVVDPRRPDALCGWTWTGGRGQPRLHERRSCRWASIRSALAGARAWCFVQRSSGRRSCGRSAPHAPCPSRTA